MALINSLCGMMNTSPFHRENYSRLILGVVIQFYQRCSDRFQALTIDSGSESSRGPQVALSVQWVQRPELQTCLTELMNTEVSYLLKQCYNPILSHSSADRSECAPADLPTRNPPWVWTFGRKHSRQGGPRRIYQKSGVTSVSTTQHGDYHSNFMQNNAWFDCSRGSRLSLVR